MNKKKLVLYFIVGFLIVVGIINLVAPKSSTNWFKYTSDKAKSSNEIMHLQMNGVILNGKKILENLKKYSNEESVKALVIEINSPGGAVGPSQEIYYEILRVKKETGKPVICVSTGLIASGGYYAALACDKLIVAPGTMIGSIGVIMEFLNLEDLYAWAKVKRFTITSGKYKDSGSEYRAMRDDEKELFKEMIDEVYLQFKNAVIESRKLDEAIVAAYADGRVMTGAKAVQLKFADAEGTFEDAVRTAAQEAKLGEDYEVVEPHREKESLFQMLMSDDDADDDLNAMTSEMQTILQQLKSQTNNQNLIQSALQVLLKTKYANQPMYLMPGYWE